VIQPLPNCHINSAKLSHKMGRGRRGTEMQITISDFGDAVKKVTLVGKLDIMGAEKIGLPLAAAAGSRSNIVVDMVGVDFIASIGIRHLVMAAKAVARGAGKLVLLDPNPMVTEVLVVSGLDQLLPIVRSEEEARAAFGAASA
jgi:anti-anti-sigma factor